LAKWEAFSEGGPRLISPDSIGRKQVYKVKERKKSEQEKNTPSGRRSKPKMANEGAASLFSLLPKRSLDLHLVLLFSQLRKAYRKESPEPAKKTF
jgi:hypothetical protein